MDNDISSAPEWCNGFDHLICDRCIHCGRWLGFVPSIADNRVVHAIHEMTGADHDICRKVVDYVFSLEEGPSWYDHVIEILRQGGYAVNRSCAWYIPIDERRGEDDESQHIPVSGIR